MKRLKCSFILVTIFLAAHVQAASPISKFDEFGDINCEDEYARLDNFAIQLHNTPSAQGYLIFYGGRASVIASPGRRSRRAGRTTKALSGKPARNSADQVVVINGGHQENFSVELWIVPAGAEPPTPSVGVPTGAIKFRKGRVNKCQFECNI